MGDTGSTVLLVVVLVLLMAFSMGLQFLRTRRAPLGRAVSILTDLNHNAKQCESTTYNRRIGRLKTGSWDRNRDRVPFLPEELRQELVTVFEQIDQVNERIDAAIRFKSDSYMESISLDKLKTPLNTCRDQLKEWVTANMSNPDYLPKKRRSLFRRF